MTEQQNTRPSASREIAVKELGWFQPDPNRLEWWSEPTLFWAVGLEKPAGYRIKKYMGREDFSLYGPGSMGNRVFPSLEKAQAFAQADYERRILSAIDTTPGNTDPIAKDDDLVQGGWRDMDSAPRDGCAVLLWWPHWWHDAHPGYYLNNQWHSDKALSSWSEGDEGGPTHWMPLPPPPTEHPTEQPSVRAGAVDALAAYQQADQDGIMVLVSRQAIEECLPALRSLAQEGE